MISQYKTSEDVILKGNEQRETQEFLLKEFLTKLREPKPKRHVTLYMPADEGGSRKAYLSPAEGQANKSAGWMPWH